MVDFHLVKFHPQAFFKAPHDVMLANDLSRSEKIDVLKQWAYDEREMSVAEEENMPALDKERVSVLGEIQETLIELEYSNGCAPTKQGG
ncbi:MAG: hypothetical protein WAW86_03665 [Gammaproteobacteria bacterium]